MSVPKEKTLSNGTLGLRFMQNALRAKQQAAVEAERAKIENEAEWEIPKEIRDAWSTNSMQQRQTVSYEASYLPFLFSTSTQSASGEDSDEEDPVEKEETDEDVGKISGRRSFNKQGKEVKPSAESDVQASSVKVVDEFPKGMRPTSLRSTNMKRSGGPIDRNVLSSSNKKVAVLKMISGEKQQDVGLDIRTARKVTSKVSGPSNVIEKVSAKPQSRAIAFLRPEGVDTPRSGTGVKSSKRDREAESVTFDAEGIVSTPTTKFDDGERLKKKKKKKQSMAETHNS